MSRYRDSDDPSVSVDAHPPMVIARLVETVGVAKADMPVLKTITLGILAGVFIAFGGLLYTVVLTGSELGHGPTRLLAGMAFSLGLILVLVGGAELFTGNSLIVMAWADHKVTSARLLRNWGLVYLGNLIGAVATAVLVAGSGVLDSANGTVAETAGQIATGKLALDPLESLIRAVLCNVLVCLAVWLCFAARSVTDKILAIIPPITAFVAMGFEHSVANMYLIPVAFLVGVTPTDPAGFAMNLVVVSLGNAFGGGVLVAGVYWLVYLRQDSASPE
ncbi:MAG: formate/nitrite transporter family protein [Alphaproteobacteria bacterium]|nr:formate/nitrite transporter family protein [Alphaproteobacteria bacterium]